MIGEIIIVRLIYSKTHIEVAISLQGPFGFIYPINLERSVSMDVCVCDLF